jgi:rhodanese-related sulfurtransferase
MQEISREQVRSLMRRNVSVVEVLPEPNFREGHLPGAINVPFDEAFDEHIQSAIPYNTALIASVSCRLRLLNIWIAWVTPKYKADWQKARLQTETG